MFSKPEPGSKVEGLLVQSEIRRKLSMNSSLSSSPTLGLLQGPVGIFWDIENCSVPGDVEPETVAGNIRTALQVNHITDGSVTVFSAYGDFSNFSRRLREACQQTGVKLVDVPNGRKDAADKAILLDLLLFAMDNRPPSTIILISGDVDFAPAVHVLNQRGYTVVLVIRSGDLTSPALKTAGRFVWDWTSLVCGRGLVSPHKPRELSSIWHEVNEIVPKEIASSPSVPKASQLPKDLNGLKGRFVNLLNRSGHVLPLARISEEYCKLYGQALCVSDYGAADLNKLLKKMSDTVVVEGRKGGKRVVRLRWN